MHDPRGRGLRTTPSTASHTPAPPPSRRQAYLAHLQLLPHCPGLIPFKPFRVSLNNSRFQLVLYSSNPRRLCCVADKPRERRRLYSSSSSVYVFVCVCRSSHRPRVCVAAFVVHSRAALQNTKTPYTSVGRRPLSTLGSPTYIIHTLTQVRVHIYQRFYFRGFIIFGYLFKVYR